MSRNSEVFFSTLPSINIQRSVMDINTDHKTTFDVGQLVPIYCAEMLPSDSVKIRTNKVIRLQTLLTPLMSNMVADVFWFFIPNRLTWSHWKEFMGENTSSAYLPSVTYRPPQIKIGGSVGANDVGDLSDHLGLPIIPSTSTTYITPTAFQFRAYWLVWNEFFRDQNLQNPINIPMGDSDVNWSTVKTNSMNGLLPVNRLHDYFSSCLIAPAKTADGFVTAWTTRVRATTGNPFINEAGNAGSGKTPIYSGSTVYSTSGNPSVHIASITSGSTASGHLRANPNTLSGTTNAVEAISDSGTTSSSGFRFDNLYAATNLNNFGITIPDLRQAFQMQKFLEREASHGSRYIETLLSHFSVRSQDSRLQRPEYLGGNRIPLNISQVLNQAQSSGEYLGDVGGYSLTSDSHFDVEYSAQEHGVLLGLIAVRYKNSYSQGFDKSWYKNTRYDYAWPEFAHLTDQAVYNWELYVDPTDNSYTNGVFGYQERYAEYKFKPDIVSGEMRPGISNSLASWHLGDYYTSQVHLSDQWLRVSKAPVDRALAVTSSVSNQLFGDFYFQCRWTRPLPVHSNPGFADHF